jgi:hypothetical protein
MPEVKAARAGVIGSDLQDVRDRHVMKWAEVLRSYFTRQEQALISRLPPGAAANIEQVWYDGDRWDRELADDLYQLSVATATVWARHIAASAEAEADLVPERMYDYLSRRSRSVAAEINTTTRETLSRALVGAVAVDVLREVFRQAAETRAAEMAESQVTAVSNFGAVEGAKQAGLGTKTWRVNSAHPRPDHALMNGETVGIRDVFSNGARWPGDPILGADGNAGCQCTVEFSLGGE